MANSINQIRTIALVGQAGSGKTTLAECLLASGRVDDARRLAEDGVRRGDLATLFRSVVTRADSATGTTR